MLDGREVRILLKGGAKESYLALKAREDDAAQTILRSFERVKTLLRTDPQAGQPIRKQLIPRAFKRFGIGNLYRIALAGYWRMLYTIEGDTTAVYVFILFLGDHPSYDRLFGYRKR